jgi:multicomponent Na+:H+ antiporter subunit F
MNIIESAPVLAAVAWGAGLVLSLGMAAAFVRLVLGPSLTDRVVAVDTLAVMAVGALVLVAVAEEQPVLLDIALAVALVMFIGTVAMAMAIGRGMFK